MLAYRIALEPKFYGIKKSNLLVKIHGRKHVTLTNGQKTL